jgi:hypothetical protein
MELDMDVCDHHDVTKYKVDEMRNELAEIRVEIKEIKSDIRSLLEFKWRSGGMAIILGAMAGVVSKFIFKAF